MNDFERVWVWTSCCFLSSTMMSSMELSLSLWTSRVLAWDVGLLKNLLPWCRKLAGNFRLLLSFLDFALLNTFS